MLTLSETIATFKDLGCTTQNIQRVRIPVVPNYEMRFHYGFQLRSKQIALYEEPIIRQEILAGTLMRPRNLLFVGPSMLPGLEILCSFYAGWHEYGCARALRLEKAVMKHFGENGLDDAKSAASSDLDEITRAIARVFPDQDRASEDLDHAFRSIEESALYGAASELLGIGKPERYWQLFHRMIQMPFIGWDYNANLCILVSD